MLKNFLSPKRVKKTDFFKGNRGGMPHLICRRKNLKIIVDKRADFLQGFLIDVCRNLYLRGSCEFSQTAGLCLVAIEGESVLSVKRERLKMLGEAKRCKP